MRGGTDLRIFCIESLQHQVVGSTWDPEWLQPVDLADSGGGDGYILCGLRMSGPRLGRVLPEVQGWRGCNTRVDPEHETLKGVLQPTSWDCRRQRRVAVLRAWGFGPRMPLQGPQRYRVDRSGARGRMETWPELGFLVEILAPRLARPT